ncbi:MAG: glycosyltransferase, partial [Pseudomonadales bacterium]
VVVPTYQEAANLLPLSTRVDEVLKRAGIVYELLIVDDCSPDDTVSVCERLVEQFPLRLLQPGGRPRDLSLSVIDGIRAANNDLVLVMDADLSHPPEKIPEMVSLLSTSPGAFVVGSRYVQGGSFDRSWSLWRFINSHIATMLARPLVKCLDPMSGFFLFDRRYIGEIDALRPLGYKIGLELMVRGHFDEIIEVPIAFADREIGASKMNLTQQVKYLRHLRLLYLYKFGGLAEFVHFGVVGASGFIVDVTFYYSLQLLGVPHQIARGISFWPAVSWNWMMNRMTTFGGRKRRPKGRQWLEFTGASLLGFSVSFGVYVLLTSSIEFFDRYRELAFIAGVLSASILNFTMSTLFVYSEKRR